MSEIHVTGLSVYPIKSCAAAEMATADVTPYGLEYDREWVITRPNGLPLTQRMHPEMALIETSLTATDLRVAAPTLPDELTIPLDLEGPEREIVLFKKPGTGIDQGKEAAAYLSNYLRQPVKLYRAKQPRTIRPDCQIDDASPHTLFADGFPMLLASQSSLDALNQVASKPITMDRFRPNIVVDGPALEAYDEDFWRQTRIGTMSAFIVRACARCPMPNVDQSVGALPKLVDRFVTKALQHSRVGIDPLNGNEEVFFAQNLTHIYEDGLQLSVGDPVVVVDRADQPNFWPADSTV